MELMTTYQAAKKWNITPRRVEILCSQDRIEGAFKFGGNWAIPVDASKPDDKRKKVIGEETVNA
jgi:hypothetical protein